MFDNRIALLIISTAFAAIPAAIWLYIFFSKTEKSKKTVASVFLLGCLAAPTLLLIQELWSAYPQFNLQDFISNSFRNKSIIVVLILLLFVTMEEIIKLYVVKIIDQKTILIRKLNDAIRYSLVAGLAFAFTENIYYLYQFWPSISKSELAGMYIFRSIFTTCAHMIFTGVFGYYYGIGKFSIALYQQSELIGEKSLFARIISKLFNLPLIESYRQKAVLKGLFIAIFMHFTFNYLLEYNIILPVIGSVVLGYLFLNYLLKRKAGHLILIKDPTEKHSSTMVKKDEEIVIELLAMWFKEKRYVDVIHICERLLERDPDNEVVQLFKAKAMDQMSDKDVYKKILHTVLKGKDELSNQDQNIISKYTAEKEKVIKNTKQPVSSEAAKKSSKGDPLENYIGEGTFKLG